MRYCVSHITPVSLIRDLSGNHQQITHGGNKSKKCTSDAMQFVKGLKAGLDGVTMT